MEITDIDKKNIELNNLKVCALALAVKCNVSIYDIIDNTSMTTSEYKKLLENQKRLVLIQNDIINDKYGVKELNHVIEEYLYTYYLSLEEMKKENKTVTK